MIEMSILHNNSWLSDKCVRVVKNVHYSKTYLTRTQAYADTHLWTKFQVQTDLRVFTPDMWTSFSLVDCGHQDMYQSKIIVIYEETDSKTLFTLIIIDVGIQLSYDHMYQR